jgi:hypothetical protein
MQRRLSCDALAIGRWIQGALPSLYVQFASSANLTFKLAHDLIVEFRCSPANSGASRQRNDNTKSEWTMDKSTLICYNDSSRRLFLIIRPLRRAGRATGARARFCVSGYWPPTFGTAVRARIPKVPGHWNTAMQKTSRILASCDVPMCLHHRLLELKIVFTKVFQKSKPDPESH